MPAQAGKAGFRGVIGGNAGAGLDARDRAHEHDGRAWLQPGQGGARDEEVRAQVDSERQVPGARIGPFETATVADAHIDGDAVEAAQRSFCVRDDTSARSFVSHVGDHDDGAIALTCNALRGIGRGCFVAIRAGDRRSLAGAQDGNGASIAKRCIGIVARLRARAHHEDPATGEPAATRRAARRLGRRPEGRGIALTHRVPRSARRGSSAPSTPSCTARLRTRDRSPGACRSACRAAARLHR